MPDAAIKHPAQTRKRWYLLKVRPGFEAVVSKILRQKGLEAVVQESQRHRSKSKRVPRSGYVLCRFNWRNQQSVLTVPGVLYIAGIPKPIPLDDDVADRQAKVSFRTTFLAGAGGRKLASLDTKTSHNKNR